jgi:glutamate-1-semialdehyde 2,1-aminomutase
MISSTDLVQRAKALTDRELQRFSERTPASQRVTAKARQVLPLGVASNFQFYDPHPAVIARAAGSRMWDVDGNEYVDYNMGYGSLLAGHSHPRLAEALADQAREGTLFVSPSPLNELVARDLCDRFPFEMVRFTNSGTEATMDALRLARGYTKRDKVIKAEGCYHGHHDLVMYSVKPDLDQAGPADNPTPVPYFEGIPASTAGDVLVVPFNDLEALEQTLAAHPEEVAAFIVEPVPENMGIVLPEPGYLAGAIEICNRYGALAVFDEVKTGITAHPGGASTLFGLEPDLICLAKSIGGGVPVGAFGGRREIMELITRGIVTHQGTFNGNPLVMAAVHAVLSEIVTDEAWEGARARNERLLEGCRALIEEYSLPAHTVAMGTKGCVTYAETPVLNYRDYKATNSDLAYAHWIYLITHGILLPPGLDEQWLISVQHSEDDIDRHLEAFEGFVKELTA